MTVTLEKNAKYQATISLNFIEQIADNNFIAKKLIDEGFTNVTVTGSGAQREVTGVWSKENLTGPAPAKVIKIEKV